ncbi:MAG: Crp/Fnr family transcriptional regulator, partial [Cellulosilyticaceae bacterium]
MRKGRITHSHLEKLYAYGIEVENQASLEVHRYGKGEVILRQGLPMDYLLFVVSGKAKVYASAANGRDLLLSYYIADGIVGDVELMVGDYTASTTMVALTEFTCIALPFAAWEQVLRTNIVFVNHVGQSLATKLIRSSHKGVVTALHE